ncbi:MAG: response regulator [Balneolales bacterium]|nr:response regulator [Balneolales bacterium]
MIKLRSNTAELGLLILLVALLPLLALFFSANSIFRESIKQQQRLDLIALANSSRDQIEDLVNSRISDANTLSRLPEWNRLLQQPASGTQPDQLFFSFLESYISEKGYGDLLLIDDAGQVRFSMRHPGLAGLRISDTMRLGNEIGLSVNAANTLLQTEISNFSWYPPAQASAAFITSPVFREGLIAGNVVLKVPETLLQAIPGRLDFLGNTGEMLTFAAEYDELVFTSTPRFSPPLSSAQPVHEPLSATVRLALSGNQGGGIFTDALRNEVMAEWRYIPAMNWGLVVKIDTAEIYQPVNAFLQASALVMLLALLLAAALAWIAHRLLTRPLELLTAEVKLRDDEPLPDGLEIRGRHEVRELSEAFNNLIGKLRSHQKNLEHKVEERTAELSTALRAAEAASIAKGSFLANMSHEIRTPLNGVIGFTDLLLNTNLDDAQQQYAENANVSGKALLGVINDILDFSKIEAGGLDLDVVEAEIAEIAEQAIDIVKYQAGVKRLELLLHLPPDLPAQAVVDPVRLKQILLNLLNNAVKFTHKGEVELRLAFTKLSSSRGSYTFTVRDTGIGISEQQQRQLFKPFSQADSSTTRRYGGTGLGLAISALLAEKMGSKIWVKSEPGAGSVFGFTLETDFTDSPVIPKTDTPNPGKILIVDDNDSNRLILEHNFSYWHLDFRSCASGTAAIAALKEEDFGMMVLDYHMPDMDGLETLRQIREELALGPEKLPVLLLHSAVDTHELRQQFRSYGVVFSLVKPVKATELWYYIRKIGSGTPEPGPNEEPQGPEQNSADAGSGREAAAATVTSETASIEAALQNLNCSILIAEDIQLNMLLIRTVLKKMLPEARLLQAADGEAAVALWEAHRPDLILMDVQMPRLDGTEATGKIRDLEQKSGTAHRRRVPIIALTAGALKEEREKALLSGMDDFLTKPLDPEQLAEVLQRLLPALKPQD